ncbi:hypothetical protein BKA70DRAFT_1215246 [Coprinopsis sp. MPI-PUGE-AT-0042]|nr:hypothetical protein BKA70DRAFT_1215246 [Coprinopsis sp. MPI-PUGE-AT-0042]
MSEEDAREGVGGIILMQNVFHIDLSEGAPGQGCSYSSWEFGQRRECNHCSKPGRCCRGNKQLQKGQVGRPSPLRFLPSNSHRKQTVAQTLEAMTACPTPRPPTQPRKRVSPYHQWNRGYHTISSLYLCHSPVYGEIPPLQHILDCVSCPLYPSRPLVPLSHLGWGQSDNSLRILRRSVPTSKALALPIGCPGGIRPRGTSGRSLSQQMLLNEDDPRNTQLTADRWQAAFCGPARYQQLQEFEESLQPDELVVRSGQRPSWLQAAARSQPQTRAKWTRNLAAFQSARFSGTGWPRLVTARVMRPQEAIVSCRTRWASLAFDSGPPPLFKAGGFHVDSSVLVSCPAAR